MEKPLVYHGLSMSIQNKAGTNGDFLLVSKQRLKTTPTFALEKQTHLERKQTRFILTLPVAGAVVHVHVSDIRPLPLHSDIRSRIKLIQPSDSFQLKIVDCALCVVSYFTQDTLCLSHVVVMVTLALLTYPYISPQHVNNSTIVTIGITIGIISTPVLSFFQRSAARL